MLLDYFFLPMVIWLIGASFLARQFPGVPAWVWIVGFIVLTTALNVAGTRLAANANLLLVGVVGLVATGLYASTSVSFINFGAFTAFTCVNLDFAEDASDDATPEPAR